MWCARTDLQQRLLLGLYFRRLPRLVTDLENLVEVEKMVRKLFVSRISCWTLRHEWWKLGQIGVYIEIASVNKVAPKL